MKIHLLSDLHNEFALFEPDPNAIAQCDVVVLAGDIDLGTRGITWAREVFGSKPVIYVPGNHEFYEHHWTKLLDELREEAQRCGVFLLESQAIDLQGVRFLGCALWTDFNYFPDRSLTGAMRACERGLNDFRKIRADPLPVPAGFSASSRPARVRYGKRLTAQHVRARHRASVDWLREQMQIANDEGRRPVVVTHHLPSARSVPEKYARNELTSAYASHLDDLLLGARLWIHGHTHESFDYLVDAPGHTTRVVCNPRGYPLSKGHVIAFENARFDPTLILDA